MESLMFRRINDGEEHKDVDQKDVEPGVEQLGRGDILIERRNNDDEQTRAQNDAHRTAHGRCRQRQRIARVCAFEFAVNNGTSRNDENP